MSGMHWETRNKRDKRLRGKYPEDRMFRQPGWRDKPGPVTFRKFFPGARPVDAPAPAAQRVRKGRISLAKISILEDHPK